MQSGCQGHTEQWGSGAHSSRTAGSAPFDQPFISSPLPLVHSPPLTERCCGGAFADTSGLSHPAPVSSQRASSPSVLRPVFRCMSVRRFPSVSRWASWLSCSRVLAAVTGAAGSLGAQGFRRDSGFRPVVSAWRGLLGRTAALVSFLRHLLAVCHSGCTRASHRSPAGAPFVTPQQGLLSIPE